MHQLVTVKRAASTLGVDREVIRNMIDIGAIRGERRVVRNKEKWFIYESEFQQMLEEQRLQKKEERVDLDGLNELFHGEIAENKSTEFDETFYSNGVTDNTARGVAAEQNELIDFAPDEPLFGETSELIEESLLVTEVDEQAEDHPDRKYLVPEDQSIDKLLEALTIEFANRLCEERQLVLNLQRKLAEKTEVLNSLPDLQQKIEDAKSDMDSKDAEISALKCNVAALENDLLQLRKPWWKRLFASTNQI